HYLYLSWCYSYTDPHSFPTRRSSDLTRKLQKRKRARTKRKTTYQSRKTHREIKKPPQRNSQNYTLCFSFDGDGGFCVSCLNSTRSEEHTSELQSRENLVCRLLLEKKK